MKSASSEYSNTPLLRISIPVFKRTVAKATGKTFRIYSIITGPRHQVWRVINGISKS